MYIVVIAWTYVVFMMSITEQSAVAGVMTFLLYGAVPVTIILYLSGSAQRRRRRQLAEKPGEESIRMGNDSKPDA
jgi:hypothetical protein